MQKEAKPPVLESYMRRALDLAEQGRFGTHPNPMVGAVVVRGGEVVGEGFHAEFGGPHAEVEALRQAGEKARGADLYVTLEPCRHWGKTPPCTKAVIEAGVARVILGVEDPNLEVSGGGVAEIQAAGIEVEGGILSEACRRLIRTFAKRVRTGLPWVTLKVAMTLDGKVATHTGASRWISSETSRQVVHTRRAEVDGIITGVGTVQADDPQLNVRLERPGLRSPRRIVLDPEGQLPLGSRIARSAKEQPTTVVVADRHPEGRFEAFTALGAEILRLPCEAEGFRWEDLLRWCGSRPMNEVMIEAGPQLVGSALDARAIDSVMFFVAPKLFGGAEALSVTGGLGVETPSQAARLKEWEVKSVGPDLLIEADTEYPDSV